VISKRFSIVSTCNLCIDSISKFIKKTKNVEKKNPNCKCKTCKCSR
jgi:hypothetical protein